MSASFLAWLKVCWTHFMATQELNHVMITCSKPKGTQQQAEFSLISLVAISSTMQASNKDEGEEKTWHTLLDTWSNKKAPEETVASAPVWWWWNLLTNKPGSGFWHRHSSIPALAPAERLDFCKPMTCHWFEEHSMSSLLHCKDSLTIHSNDDWTNKKWISPSSWEWNPSVLSKSNPLLVCRDRFFSSRYFISNFVKDIIVFFSLANLPIDVQVSIRIVTWNMNWYADSLNDWRQFRSMDCE